MFSMSLLLMVVSFSSSALHLTTFFNFLASSPAMTTFHAALWGSNLDVFGMPPSRRLVPPRPEDERQNFPFAATQSLPNSWQRPKPDAWPLAPFPVPLCRLSCPVPTSPWGRPALLVFLPLFSANLPKGFLLVPFPLSASQKSSCILHSVAFGQLQAHNEDGNIPLAWLHVVLCHRLAESPENRPQLLPY
ncbi:hypothetical protein, unlikely [Trypanosoma brucei gambiense DAL972]|uniref:T. brucei spp.-specific protein n=1 Tax=Trypanosoma brucei gambiense (strain MHOM/CI/86/DAL972) TaxID=679716 RepID=C9ZNF1_TRYB9|nr:hypothetical protein, unlikely [Trypanosoma brucei gambiense DAL972]CBH10929.1 hypothetical protein, unlikely [Trypanosoma brucei gambiense DAL972]|eukprot:XP_011773216.1 hypothetical protein, unlikely [Trypanosoma brucei gambiense DAL972]